VAAPEAPIAEPQGQVAAPAAPNAEPQEAAADDDEPVEKMKKGFHNSASHAVINFLYDVMGGCHDSAIKEAVKASNLKEAKWMEVKSLANLRDLHRTLTAHRSMVQLNGGPPVPDSRTLQRHQSEAGEGGDDENQKERGETWKLCQALRKKFVAFFSVRAVNAANYQSLYEKSTAFKQDGLKPGEAHRVFLFSVDTFTESDHLPWKEPPVWTESAEVAVKFLSQQRGPADLLCFFDGRSRSCRANITKLTENTRYQTEIFVVYRPTLRLGRRVAWSANNCEICLASLPVNNTVFTARDRSGSFNAAGESSTHDCTYSGVQPVPWVALPRTSVQDKAKLLAQTQEAIAVPRQNLFDSTGGIPLFWQERKPVSFWKKFFEDLQARCIVDLSPGSGLAARAAMELGVPYLGITRTAEHGQWLGNVCDRYALQAAVTSGTALHSADLQGSIEDHFGDVLTHVRNADAAVDKEFNEDEADA